MTINETLAQLAVELARTAQERDIAQAQAAQYQARIAELDAQIAAQQAQNGNDDAPAAAAKRAPRARKR